MQKSTTARRADGPDKDWPGSRRKRTQCANVTAQLCVGVPSSLPPTPRSHLPLVTFCNCHFIFCLYLFLCISHFSVCMPDCPSLCLSVSVSVRVSVCPSHCLSVSLPVCQLVSVSCPAFTSTIRACPEHPVSFCKVLMPCGNGKTVKR